MLVDLALGTASDGWGGTDSLSGVVQVRGSDHNDTLAGNSSTAVNDHFITGAGNDSVDGRAGFDFLDYGATSGPIAVSLSFPDSGTVQKGAAGVLGTDSFISVEGINGTTGFNDTFNGTGLATAGQLTSFQGWGGNDSFDGANNTGNQLSYGNSPTGVLVDLSLGLASDGWGGTDTLSRVANVVGTDFADSLKGSASATSSSPIYLQGGRGNDTIDGAFNGFNLADYNAFPTTGILANLATGLVQDGQGGTDSLVNLPGIRGSSGNDTILAGGTNFVQIRMLDGNGGFDVVDFSNGSNAITVTLSTGNTGTVTSGGAFGYSLSNIEQIIGSSGNDSFIGSLSATFTNLVGMVGGAGNDSFVGANNFWNAVDYRTSPAGVTVDLGLGTAQDGFGGTDSLNGINYVFGSDFADSLKGGTAGDTFSPGHGNDTIDGATGFNNLDYARYGSTTNFALLATFTGNTAGTVVTTQNAVAAGTDSFSNIQRIRASGGADTLVGTTLTSGTTITLEGDAGNDSIDGKSSLLNFVSYSSSFQSITVDLAAGVASDGWGGTDTLVNVRRVGGGSAGDSLLGSTGDDYFAGSGGSDGIVGGAGADTLDETTQSNALTVVFTADGRGTAVKTNVITLGTDSFTGIEVFQASNGADSIQGFAGAATNEWLRGMNGNDTIDAASNAHNIVDYNGSGSAITANLATGVVTGQGTDQVNHFVAIRGSTGNDIFRSGAGSYIVDGGNGFGTLGSVTSPGVGGGDAMDYRGYASPITLNGITNQGGTTSYFSGSVTKADGTDTFSAIRGVFASTGDDSLVGTTDTAGTNNFVLRGEQGNDTLSSPLGALNTADYIDSPTGVLVHLQTTPGGALAGTADDGWGTHDVLLGFTSVRGSDAGNDTIIGSDRGDFFWGTRGSDSIDGNGGNDSLNYNNGLFQVGFSGSIGATVTGVAAGMFGFGQGSVVKSGGGSDQFAGINAILGTPNADVLRGLQDVAYSWNNMVLRGNAGNDTIYGYNSGFNRADYSAATAAVSLDLGLGADAAGNVLGTAQDGQGGTDRLVGIVNVRGSSFNDTMLGSALSDSFTVGSGGSHLINGRGGANEIRYTSTSAVVIDLGTVATVDGFGGYQGTLTKGALVDTLLNIAVAQGNAGDDTILGTPGNNQLTGGSGNNSIDGRDGYDTLNYRFFTGITAPTHGAVIDLAAGSATNPWDGTDTLTNVEGATGSQFAYDITGTEMASGAASFLRGDGGNDTLRATATGTHITADYLSSLEGITANLASGIVSNDGWFGGTDQLVNLHAIRGSQFDDVVTLTDGNDTVDGAGGHDVVVFARSSAATTLTLNLDGSWTAVGPGGSDQLMHVEIARFADGDVSLAGTTTVVGTAGDDTIRPGSSSAGVSGVVDNQGDSITGNGGNDQLQGGAGNDSITGGSDDDTFFASAGNDSYLGGGGGDRISYSGSGQGGLGVSVNLTTGSATNTWGGSDVLSGIRNVEGSAGNDTLVGIGAAVLALGPGGAPTLTGTRFFGSGGSDSLDGVVALARSWADYSGLAAAITASYSDTLHATVSKSLGGTDTLVTVTGIVGTDGNDSLAGSPVSPPIGTNNFGTVLVGGPGNDTINGFSNGTNRVDYSGSTSAANINLSAGTASDGLGGTDTLTNVTQVRGTGFNDTMLGGANFETFMVSNAGNHSIDGGGGGNTYRYFGIDNVLVDITLASSTGGFASKPGGAVDTLRNINGITTGEGNDTLIGNSGNDTLQGAGGNNLLDGRGGDNWVQYNTIVTSIATHGVVVNLQTGHAANPWDGQDFLLNVQNVVGSPLNDSITGTSANSGTFSVIRGMIGDDTLAAPFANTHVEADYSQDPAGVTVNLVLGTVTDGWGGQDQLINIQAVRGSSFNDSITGSALNDILTGGPGNDTIDGGGVPGTDVDIAIINSSFAAASIIITDPDGVRITSIDGSDVYRNIELYRFTDRDFSFVVIDVNGTAGNDSIHPGFVNTAGTKVVDDSGETIFGGGGGNDQLQGGAGDDSIVGGNGADTFFGGAGNDTFYAGGGRDRVSYTGFGQATVGVTVNLTTGIATNTAGGQDSLIGIRDIQGSAGDDTLIGTDILSGAAGISGYPSAGTNFTASAGNDSINGALPLAATSITYNTISGAINVSFTDVTHATVVKSLGGTDTLVNVQAINGSAGDDTISGVTTAPSLGAYFTTRNLQGGAGNDQIDGHGLSINRAHYTSATSAVNINLETGIVSDDGQGGHDQLINIVNVRGSNFNDTILGSQHNDTIQTSMLGSHLLDGAGGSNVYSYYLTNAEDVLIDLGTTAATDGGGGYQGFVQKATGATDTLLRFNGASAPDGNDTLLGTPGEDTLAGGAGNNSLDGRGGHDWLNYGTTLYNVVPTHGATANLTTGTATNPWDGTDTLLNLQSAIGTPYADSLTGINPADGSYGYLQGRNGDDTLAAPGTGTHIVADYSVDEAAVTVNLALGTATDGFGGHDTLVNINAVRGSMFADSLTGSSGNDTFDGFGGNDTIIGNGGIDLLVLHAMQAQTSVSRNPNGSWNIATPGGTIRFGGINAVQFDDVTLPLVIAGTSGNDTIRPGTSSAGVTGAVNNLGDAIFGGGGNDQLQGGTGNDTLQGGSGNDSFFGSLGSDSIIGVDGLDRLDYGVLSGNISVSYAGSSGTAGKSVGGSDGFSGNFTRIATGAGNDTITIGTASDTQHFHFVDAGTGTNAIGGGSNANNVVDFSFASGAMTINLLTGTATGPSVSDTLTNVRSVQLSRFNDTVTGSASGENDFLISATGSHSITGGAGNNNRLVYFNETGSITANLATGVIVHAGGTDSVSNIQRLVGTYGADSITGSTGNDVFYTLGGADTINGNGGVDRLSFNGYNGTLGFGPSGVNIDLASGTGTNTFGNAISFSGIRNLEGSNLNDTLLGTNILSGAAGLGGYPSSGTTFFGSTGSDSIDGVLNLASVSINYGNYTGPLTASFTDWNHGTVDKGANGSDTLAHINQFTGSNGADSIAGTPNAAAAGTYSFTLNLAGAGGNDTINGFNNTQNRADYATATAAAVISLATGIAADGQGGTDSLVGVLRVRGSNFDDTITGSASSEIFEVQLAGNHSIDGGGGSNTIRYSGLEDVAIDLGTATVAGGGYIGSVAKLTGGVDTLLRFNAATGGDGFDTILGTPDNDTLAGGAGGNILDGRGGNNTLSYSTNFYGTVPTHGATVNLVTGTAANPWNRTDTLSHFVSVIGTPFADSMLGAAPASGTGYLRGGNEADTIAAASAGLHIAADYITDPTGVSVDLGAGTAVDGWGNVDKLVNINAVRGSSQADSLRGGAGDDSFEGGGGDDTVDGGGGRNTVTFGSAFSFADPNADGSVDIATPTGVVHLSHVQTLVFSDITLQLLISGSSHDDTIRPGASSASVSGAVNDYGDTILGNGGNDVLQGGSWNDSLVGGNGNDSFFGSDGNDSFLGGGGHDRLSYGGSGQGALGVNVNLATGVATNSFGGQDHLSGINDVQGTSGDDTLTGSTGSDTFDGAGGNDSIDGGGEILAGGDVVRFHVNQAAATLGRLAADSWTVTIGGAITKLVAVRSLLFDDGLISLLPPAAPAAPALAAASDSGTAGDGITDLVHPTLTGSAPAGSSVAVFDGSTLLGVTSADASTGAWTLATTLGLGSHSLTAVATDTHGNASPASAALALEIVAPPQLFLTTAGGLTNLANHSIAGIAAPGSVVSIFEGASLLGSTNAAGDGTWATTVALSGEGAHHLAAVATDAHGDISPTRTLDLELDSLAPSVSLVGSGGIVGSLTQLVSGTIADAHPGTTVLLFDNGNAAPIAAATMDSLGNWSTSITLAGVGTHSIVARSADAAGNTGSSPALVFTVPASASLGAVVTLDSTSGGHPAAGLVRDASGNLYGTTETGGANGAGTAFMLSGPNHATLTVLHDFSGGADGGLLIAGLVADAAGNLYGATVNGGSQGGGTVFQLSGPAHTTLTTLYDFTGGADGGNPFGALVLDAAGTLYGTTEFGGAGGLGTVFSLAGPNHGTLTTLASFSGGPEGGQPQSGLVLDAAGTLFGTTSAGGSSGAGTIFALSGPGHDQFTTIAEFSNDNGAYPFASLTLGRDGNLYGTTTGGGAANAGTVFMLSGTDHATLTTLLSFDGAGQGDAPFAGLLTDSAGNLFGVTRAGGAHGAGTLYELSGSDHRTLTILSSFDPATTGGSPFGGLAADAGGTLFGTTGSGGGNGLGTIYQLLGASLSATVAAPGMLALDAASDSGILGDGITYVTAPRLTGTAPAGSLVALFDAGTLVGTTSADGGTGAWALAPTLGLGSHSLTATATDAQGHSSVASAALALTIQAAPTPPTHGDLNGDGRADPVFQHSSGDVWALPSTGPATQVFNTPAFKALFVGDLNGDGTADILFSAPGQGFWLWQMSGNHIASQGAVADPGGSWQVRAIADVNADGRDDLIWQDADGNLDVWEMDGLGSIATGYLGNTGTYWKVIGAEDLNGDGKADLIFQGQAGELWQWPLDGLTVLPGSSLGTPGLGWHLVG